MWYDKHQNMFGQPNRLNFLLSDKKSSRKMGVQWHFGCWPHCGKQPSRNLLHWKGSHCYQEIHQKCCIVAIKKRIRSQKKVIMEGGKSLDLSLKNSDLDCRIVSKKDFQTSFLEQEHLIA